MAQIAVDAPAARKNRRGSPTDHFAFHLFRSSLLSILPSFLVLGGLAALLTHTTLSLPLLGLDWAALAVLTLLLIWFNSRQLAQIVLGLAQAAIAIGDGDWSVRTLLRGPVELRTLAYRLNATAAMLQGLREAVNIGSLELSAASQAQVEAAVQTTQRAAKVAQGASATNVRARQMVGQTAAARTDMEQAQADFSTFIAHNQEDSIRFEQVDGILGLINTIAAKTSLLALNAAIEAERAGPQGRGLAAIAEDIRHLAADAKDKAGAISLVLEEVKVGHNEVATDLAQAARQLASGVSSLQSLVEASQQVQETSAEQLADSEQVRSDMEQVTSGAQRIVKTAEQISAAHLFRHRERRG
jgi:methyl-accepting chemotaxis protein